MTSARHSLLPIIAFTLASVLVAGACRADVVRLRRSATLPADAPVLLRDVADLEGQWAARCAEVVIVESPSQRLGTRAWFEIDVREVAEAIRGASHETSRLAIDGARCVVRAEGAAPSPRRQRASRPEPAPPVIVQPGAPVSVRSLIAGAIADAHGVGVDDVRLRFLDPRHPVLDITPDDGRIALTRGAPDGARAVFRVEVFRGDQTVERAGVSVDVEIRRRVLIARETIRRGRAIAAADFERDERWLAPTVDAIEDQGEALGRRAARRIAQGTVISPEAIEPALLVRKNEQVTVVCLNRSIQVQVPGRALGDGARGDLIEVQRLNARERFVARVDGPRRVILDLETTRPDEATQ